VQVATKPPRPRSFGGARTWLAARTSREQGRPSAAGRTRTVSNLYLMSGTAGQAERITSPAG
jgi:hypothetical protein